MPTYGYRIPPLSEFIELVNRTVQGMNHEVNTDAGKAEYYKKRNGAKLEEDVYNKLVVESIGTDFENTIELVSNRSFPDIVVANQYGVEVKTSKKGWKSVGSSIMESSRIANVEYIYIIFGNLGDDLGFQAKSYEECLSDIVVTHSPRYSIDMNLSSGDTIFDKMETEYETFRNLESPIDVVKEYYRSKLTEGQNLWWMTSQEADSQALSPIVKLWTTLNSDEKLFYKIKGFCWFPEIFGNSRSKYQQFAIWLTTQNGIVVNSLRDPFTAGGKEDITHEGKVWDKQPQILNQLYMHREKVRDELLKEEEDIVKELWNVEHVAKGEERIEQWISIVKTHTNEAVEDFLNSIFR